MRIVFLTQDDPIYVLPFFEEFMEQPRDDIEVVGVFSSPTMGRRSRLQMVKELVQLYGAWGFLRLAGMRLHAKLRARIPPAAASTRCFSLDQLCRAKGICSKRIGNPNEPGFQHAIASLRPDAIVSVACPFILKPDTLKLAPLGCLNIHHAPLPFFKGMMPSFWQMYHGATTVGVTVHFMGTKLDEGDAILQESMPIMPGETLHQLICRSKRNGAHVMIRALGQLRDRTYSRISIGGDRGSYYTFPRAAEIREFRRKGFRAI